jgi:trk system potassium uptake protein TrkH
MRFATIGAVTGWLLLFLAVAVLFPVGFSVYYGDGVWHAFVITSIIALVFGAGLVWSCTPGKEISHREGFAIVAFAWLAAAAVGALPYFISCRIPSYLDAYFEAMSGFTTTGSTILSAVEPLGPGLLFWRSLTHWLGGMGIIVLSIAILPILGIGGMQLFQAEMPGPTKDRLAPRIQDTARILWTVYLGFTVIETVLLMWAGMSFYEAVCHAFATMATGGFSTDSASVAGFGNPLAEYIIIVFMILAGMNFTLHYRLLRRDFKRVFSSEELRFYLATGFGATLLVLFFNWSGGIYASIGDNFRDSLFQVWSILTTTGFGTADFDLWPPVCRIILVTLMFLGGMAGSTGGGIKHVRIVIFWKFTRVQIRRLIHPRAVEAIKLDGKRVPDEVVQSILGYLSLYMAVFIFATLVVTSQGVDIVTGSTAVIATLNNIGPGLAGVGATKNFADIPSLSKVVLIFCMVAGRLELYTLVLLFIPSYWKGARFSDAGRRSAS